jgi:hypothetical protein
MSLAHLKRIQLAAVPVGSCRMVFLLGVSCFLFDSRRWSLHDDLGVRVPERCAESRRNS